MRCLPERGRSDTMHAASAVNAMVIASMAAPIANPPGIPIAAPTDMAVPAINGVAAASTFVACPEMVLFDLLECMKVSRLMVISLCIII